VNSARTIAIVAGALFLVTEVAAIVGRLLYQPVLSDPRYIVKGSGSDPRVLLGAFSEVILAIAVIGTAVTLFPIIRRQDEGLALGYVGGRLLEAVIIVIGIISVLSVVRLRQDLAGGTDADAFALETVGKYLVGVLDWTFLLGPHMVLGANTVLLAYLLNRAGLVPGWISVLGLIAGPLIFASATSVLFGVYKQASGVATIAAIPMIAWELSLAVWLIFKGFNPSPITQFS
jgi:hypothetical protein